MQIQTTSNIYETKQKKNRVQIPNAEKIQTRKTYNGVITTNGI